MSGALPFGFNHLLYNQIICVFSTNNQKKVPPLGFEPRTPTLRVSCSSQLSYRGLFFFLWGWWDSNPHPVRDQFLRLACLPFHHIPKNFVDPGGLEPPLSEPESDVLATTLWVNKKNLRLHLPRAILDNATLLTQRPPIIELRVVKLV